VKEASVTFWLVIVLFDLPVLIIGLAAVLYFLCREEDERGT
jgi:hypothetical protein